MSHFCCCKQNQQKQKLVFRSSPQVQQQQQQQQQQQRAVDILHSLTHTNRKLKIIYYETHRRALRCLRVPRYSRSSGNSRHSPSRSNAHRSEQRQATRRASFSPISSSSSSSNNNRGATRRTRPYLLAQTTDINMHSRHIRHRRRIFTDHMCHRTAMPPTV